MDDLLEEYLNEVIKSYERDPADNDYQLGYLASAKEALAWLEGQRKRLTT